MDRNSTLAMPPPAKSGLVPTLNGKGFMTPVVADRYSQRFVQHAVQCGQWALDVGAAYGVHTLAALNEGAQVIANDEDPRHLELLLRGVPPHLTERLRLLPGTFPDVEMEDGSVGAALVCRVFHFMDGPTIEAAVAKLAEVVVLGGLVVVIADSPYVPAMREFIPTYERRRAKGCPWPGLVEDMTYYAPEAVRRGVIPKTMNFLDPGALRRAFSVGGGFRVEQASFFARGEGFPDDLKLDDREAVGLVAIRDDTIQPMIPEPADVYWPEEETWGE